MRKHISNIAIGIAMITAVADGHGQLSSPALLGDSIPEKWQMTQQCFQTLPTDDSRWKMFDDPVLDNLISQAVANNYNVAAALKRIDMSRKSVQEARAGYFPTLTVSGGWSRAQQSGAVESSGCAFVCYFLFFAWRRYELGDRCVRTCARRREG